MGPRLARLLLEAGRFWPLLLALRAASQRFAACLPHGSMCCRHCRRGQGTVAGQLCKGACRAAQAPPGSERQRSSRSHDCASRPLVAWSPTQVGLSQLPPLRQRSQSCQKAATGSALAAAQSDGQSSLVIHLRDLQAALVSVPLNGSCAGAAGLVIPMFLPYRPVAMSISSHATV